MARYSQEHKAKNHKKILSVAAKLFGQMGYRQVKVDQIMKAAGLTSGGFYAHFKSKEHLFIEAIKYSNEKKRVKYYQDGLDKVSGLKYLESVISRYLSEVHRDSAEHGCPFPSLVSEMSQLSKPVREALQDELLNSVKLIAAKTPKGIGLNEQDRALATFSLMVGSLSLSRVVKDPKLSNKILKASRQLLLPEKQKGKKFK